MLFEGLSLWLNISIITLCILLFGVSIWCMVLQFQIFFRYMRNNKRHVGGKTAKEVAEDMLEKLGYDDIKVVRASWLWLIFFSKWGNRYSPRRKKILLYGNILNKDTVTAIALATQKVGLVVQYKEGDKQMLFRAKWEPWTRIAPNLLLPIVTLGVLIDLVVNQWAYNSSAFGIISLVFLALAIIYSLIALYALYLIIPTEKRAGELAEKIIEDNNLLSEEHLGYVKTLYATYVKKYIADFIMAILEIIIDVLRILAAIAKAKK